MIFATAREVSRHLPCRSSIFPSTLPAIKWAYRNPSVYKTLTAITARHVASIGDENAGGAPVKQGAAFMPEYRVYIIGETATSTAQCRSNVSMTPKP